MQSTDRSIPLEYSGIRFTKDSLCEIDSGSIMITVSRQDARSITLRYGVQALHPLGQIVVGSLLMVLGYLPLRHFIDWAQHGGVFVTVEAWIIPFALIGGWLVIGATRRGYFLEVEQTQGTKRLAFSGKPTPDELKTFLTAVEECHGLKIEREYPYRGA